jgi:lipoprotein-anchoring transpeptidase ErfK/SrfK
MGLSSLFRLPKLPSGLLVVPFLALALAGPASAETKVKPQNPPANGTPSAQAKSTTPAPKLKLDTNINQSGASQSAGQKGTNTAQPGAKGAGEGSAQSGTNTAQPEAKAGESDKKATQPVEAGVQPLSPNPKQILVNIDKSTQEATVFVDGVEQYTWKVSTGKPGHITPSGTYTATSMNEIWYSKEWDNAPMPHAVFFMKDGHAIHGTTEVKNLGKPASHGCVRLAPENATILYDLVKENGLQNTQVVLSGETPGGEYEGVAMARPQYQYPQYPYGYGYGRGQAVAPPWYNGQEAQVQPDQQRPRRRGLFRWFQQNQGYYAPPPPPRYYQRGYGY